MRRLERSLIREYRRLVDTALTRLTPDSQGIVVEIAALPDVVRGYEDVKLKSVARMRERASALLAQLDATPAPVGSLEYAALTT